MRMASWTSNAGINIVVFFNDYPRTSSGTIQRFHRSSIFKTGALDRKSGNMGCGTWQVVADAVYYFENFKLDNAE